MFRKTYHTAVDLHQRAVKKKFNDFPSDYTTFHFFAMQPR